MELPLPDASAHHAAVTAMSRHSPRALSIERPSRCACSLFQRVHHAVRPIGAGGSPQFITSTACSEWLLESSFSDNAV
eukprot:1004195-Amphidinium_carterae.1